MASTLSLENEREMLSQVIVDAVRSWPDLHRRIFTQVHYAGKSAEEISRPLGLTGGEVREILSQCEWKLRQALKSFRRALEDPTSTGVSPSQRLTTYDDESLEQTSEEPSGSRLSGSMVSPFPGHTLTPAWYDRGQQNHPRREH